MKWEKDPVVVRASRWEADPVEATRDASGKPAIEIGPGLAIPELLQPSSNPNSAGTYPVGRRFTVGDRARVRQSDILTGAVQREFERVVTRVDHQRDRVEMNEGVTVWDTIGNPILIGQREIRTPAQLVPAELQVGKRWIAEYTWWSRRFEELVRDSLSLTVVAREPVVVPAGRFSAFRIEASGGNAWDEIQEQWWLMPWLNSPVRHDRVVVSKLGRAREIHRYAVREELVSARQWAISD